jgi:predicted small metal-binding protein
MAKEISCAAPNCKFRLRSEDEDELVALVQQHAKAKHQMDASREELLAAAKESE